MRLFFKVRSTGSMVEKVQRIANEPRSGDTTLKI